jgi:hypothetical protein
MSGPAELTDRQVRQLREVYATLHELAADGGIPAVVAGCRAALAEVHAAMVGQGLEFDFYSHRWLGADT